jgi:hypothetical protein
MFRLFYEERKEDIELVSNLEDNKDIVKASVIKGRNGSTGSTDSRRVTEVGILHACVSIYIYIHYPFICTYVY